MRKMATIRKIDALTPIDGADAIEAATIGGWKVVVKKGEFSVGDLAVYCEIDSWIPTELAPFLSKGKEPREFEGIKGERLRTVRLRKQLSQGLLLPLTVITDNGPDVGFGFSTEVRIEEGFDVSEPLGIVKWELPMNAQLAGMARGNFPSFIPKTDQERAQNLVKEIVAANEAGLRFEITEKLEGSSMTVYLNDEVFGVCSRNLDLKETEDNSFWQVARRDGIEEKMRAVPTGSDFAIQGELIGPGIQGNIYKLTEPEFRVFDVYNITIGEYLNPVDRRALVDMMGLKHAPVLVAGGSLYDTLGITDMPQLLKFAEGKSVMGDITGPEREGIVFKQVDGGMTFKVISNKYLLGEK
jgi:RNA ligase (TIGR02306 family)